MGGSPTLANLGNDHGVISKEYISIGMRPFGAHSVTIMLVQGVLLVAACPCHVEPFI